MHEYYFIVKYLSNGDIYKINFTKINKISMPYYYTIPYPVYYYKSKTAFLKL